MGEQLDWAVGALLRGLLRRPAVHGHQLNRGKVGDGENIAGGKRGGETKEKENVKVEFSVHVLNIVLL